MKRLPFVRVGPLAAAAVLVAVSGCANFKPPEPTATRLPELPATFVQAQASASIATRPAAAAFWRDFQSDELTALVEQALPANRDVRLAAARVLEARSLLTLSGAGKLPTIGLNAGASRARGDGNNVGLGLGVLWEADLFDRIGNEQAAARADLASAQALEQAASVAVAADVLRYYFELQGTLQRLQVAHEALQTQRAALTLVKARLDAGRGTALDTERASALVLATEASVPAMELQAELLRQRLAVLSGQPASALASRFASLNQARALPGLAPVALSAIDTPQALLSRRPDLRAAQAQAEAAAQRLGLAYKARLPSLSLSGSLGLNAGRLSALGNSAAFVYELAAGLAWVFEDGGAKEAQQGAAAARQLAAVVAYERAVLLALEETEGALAAYSRNARQTELLFAAAGAAERAATIARERFNVGISDFLAVLDAERERLAARDRLALAQTASAVAVVNVYRALAGGLTP
jgi:outer membrane protein, multidrug efflux system